MEITSKQIEEARLEIAKAQGVTPDRICITQVWWELDSRGRMTFRTSYNFIAELPEKV